MLTVRGIFMKRPIVRALAHARPSSIRRPAGRPTRSIVDRSPSRLGPGFTLIEVLVATVLSLIIMAAVVTVFASITTSISQSRSTLEMTDRLRTTASQLKRDLEGVTVTMLPPRRPETNEGYFEYIEGPVGPVFTPELPRTFYISATTTGTYPYAYDIDRPYSTTQPYAADTTIGDNDDILMFTTQAKDRPFVGKFGTSTVESWVAEVAWFVRGRTLYRRVLLVAPSANLSNLTSYGVPKTVVQGTTSQGVGSGYYAYCDVSAHVATTTAGNLGVIPNSLGDLTKREFRFAHPYSPSSTAGYYAFPFDARIWGQFGLPTLRETAAINSTTPYMLGSALPAGSAPPLFMARDYATNPYPWSTVDPITGTQAIYNDPTVTRLTDDVVMTNVVGFDVKAWDPGAPVLQYNNMILMPGDPYYTTALSSTSATIVYYGAYVDLGWDPNYASTTASYASKRASGAPLPYFDHWGCGYVTGHNTSSVKMNTYLNQSGLLGNNNASNSATAYAGARVYDTYSLHYEYDGITENGASGTDIGTNGADDDGLNGADDPAESETCPPYPVPLRGIQIKIRSINPESGQVREVTVVQEFLPQ
jgi:prepilin-type N-terminal cleavage/methylation domain-containing protein